MMDRDQTLIDSAKAQHARLTSAFVYGEQDNRRPVNENVKRVIGSVVLAATICAVCLGVSFVMNMLQSQKEKTAITAFQQAIASNPIQAGDDYTEDEKTGYLRSLDTGDLIDPRTGFVINEKTGFATDPDGRTVDPRIGWYVDVKTGFYTDPASGLTIDPETLKIVEPQEKAER